MYGPGALDSEWRPRWASAPHQRTLANTCARGSTTCYAGGADAPGRRPAKRRREQAERKPAAQRRTERGLRRVNGPRRQPAIVHVGRSPENGGRDAQRGRERRTRPPSAAGGRHSMAGAIRGGNPFAAGRFAIQRYNRTPGRRQSTDSAASGAMNKGGGVGGRTMDTRWRATGRHKLPQRCGFVRLTFMDSGQTAPSSPKRYSSCCYS